MFLEDYNDIDYNKVSKYAKESCTLNVMYNYWRNALFERIMRLFVFESGDVPPKEILQRLILDGKCAITKIDGEKELTAMYCSFYGVTKYQDEFTNVTVRCPVYSGTRTIGKDVVIINNNSLRNPTYDLVHHYAIMLAHTEVTLINCMINARDAGGVPVVQTSKQKASIENYQAQVFNGKYGIVTDVGNLGIEYMGADKKTQQNIMNVMECREKLIKSFYSDIGVRSAFEKRNNTVMAEVEADTSLLLLNLSDMLNSMEEGCKQVNEMFGVNWSVHIAEEIDYGAENQREQFDTSTVTHIVDKKKDDEKEKMNV